MPNIFKNQEQREKWNKYNAQYAKKTYRTISIKLNKEKDAKIIAWIENLPSGTTITDVVRELLVEKVG